MHVAIASLVPGAIFHRKKSEVVALANDNEDDRGPLRCIQSVFFGNGYCEQQ